jgi:hypothetical protein
MQSDRDEIVERARVTKKQRNRKNSMDAYGLGLNKQEPVPVYKDGCLMANVWFKKARAWKSGFFKVELIKFLGYEAVKLSMLNRCFFIDLEPFRFKHNNTDRFIIERSLGLQNIRSFSVACAHLFVHS